MEKFIKIYLLILLILTGIVIAFSPLWETLFIAFVTKKWWCLWFNLLYIILTPLYAMFWWAVKEVKDEL